MKLTIVRGLPGSGKSTFVNSEERFYVTKHIEADDFHIINGEYVYRSQYAGRAHEWCQAQVAYYLNQGVDVAVANTFITKRSVVPYYELAQEFGAEFEIITLTNDFGTVHDVPEETLDRMKQYFEDFTTEEFIEHYNEVYNINIFETKED